MSLHVIETGEVVEEMTRVEAERITSRIADKLDSIADNLEQVLPLIGEALTRKAWDALDYVSPTAYVSDRFAGALTRLPVDVRRPVVAELSAAGMSTRQIAPVMGIDRTNVTRDLQVVQSAPPERSSIPELPKSEKIIGSDGKQYARPEPKPEPVEPPKPKRRPLPDQARDAGWEIRKATERIERILNDDRFARNKEEMATSMRGHLEYVIESCQGFLDQINN